MARLPCESYPSNDLHVRIRAESPNRVNDGTRPHRAASVTRGCPFWLLRFLKWCLDRRQWPNRVVRGPKHRAHRRKLSRISRELEGINAARAHPVLDLRAALDHTHSALSVLDKEARSTEWETPGSSSNTYMQFGQMMFVASLIVRAFPHVIRKKKEQTTDPFKKIASHVAHRIKDREIYDQVRQAAYRFQKQIKWTTLQALVSLYGMYLSQTKGRIGWSDQEQRILEEITGAKPGEAVNV